MREAQTYRENYETLRQIAQRLSEQEEIDIDQLVPMVDEATKAYQVCKARIEAVEKALAERLGQLEDENNG